MKGIHKYMLWIKPSSAGERFNLARSNRANVQSPLREQDRVFVYVGLTRGLFSALSHRKKKMSPADNMRFNCPCQENYKAIHHRHNLHENTHFSKLQTRETLR